MWDIADYRARHRCLIARASKQCGENDEERGLIDLHPRDFLIVIMIRLSAMQSRDVVENALVISYENSYENVRFHATKS